MLYYIISYHIISYHIISYYMFISPALSAGRTGMSLPTTKLCSESDFAISVLLEIPTRGFAFGPSHLPWIALPYAKRERGTRRRGHAQHIHVYIYIYIEREREQPALGRFPTESPRHLGRLLAGGGRGGLRTSRRFQTLHEDAGSMDAD